RPPRQPRSSLLAPGPMRTNIVPTPRTGQLRVLEPAAVPCWVAEQVLDDQQPHQLYTTVHTARAIRVGHVGLDRPRTSVQRCTDLAWGCEGGHVPDAFEPTPCHLGLDARAGLLLRRDCIDAPHACPPAASPTLAFI